MRFPVAHDFSQLERWLTTGDQVQMVGQDRVSMDLKPFMLLAVTPTVQHNIAVYLPAEQIYPACNGTGQIIQAMLVANFVFYAHRYVGLSPKDGTIEAQPRPSKPEQAFVPQIKCWKLVFPMTNP